MIDLRNKELAKVLVDYSVEVKSKDKVVVSCTSPLGLPLVKEVYKAAILKGAFVRLNLSDDSLEYFFFKNAKQFQLKAYPVVSEFEAKWADKIISIVAEENTKRLTNVDSKRITTRVKIVDPIKKIILKKRWVITYYPTPAMAQDAKLSTEEMEDFYFNACLRDWQAEQKKIIKLKKTLDNTSLVRVIGKDTDLTFSLKDRLTCASGGRYNMPDGEVFGAPLTDTVEGKIYFDFPNSRYGKEVKDIRLEFKKGKVVKYSASYNQDALEKVLATDPGAKRVGEFAIGTNYGIKKFMNNTLFDEKIGGTIHLALGSSHVEEEGGGKNQSAIHWDLVKDTRKKGSKVIVDGKTVLKDGKILIDQ